MTEDYKEGFKRGFSAACLAGADILRESAKAYGNEHGTLVAGAYSEEAKAAVYVNVMAKANDYADMLMNLSKAVEEYVDASA